MPYHSSCHTHAWRCASTCGLKKKIYSIAWSFVRSIVCLSICSRFPFSAAAKMQIIKLNCMPSIYHCFPQRCVMYKFLQFRLHAPVTEFHATQFICTHQWHISRCWLRFPFDLIECESSTQHAWIINMKAEEKICDSIEFELENTLRPHA